jgi:hypothetical protein
MLKQILKNTIETLVGREITKQELSNAIKYIYDNLSDKDRIDIVESSLYDWRANYYFQCEDCGTWFPNEEKCTIWDEHDDGYYYCDDCVLEVRMNK